MVTHGTTRPGDWVLLHGTGGVSIFGAQIAKMLGAKTIVTTSSESKAISVKKQFDVDATVDYRDPEWPKHVKKLTGGHGADVIVEVAGGETLDRSLEACAYNARVGVIGVLGGGTSTITVRNLLSRQSHVKGIFMESTDELRALVRAVEANNLQPCIDREFPFEKARAAYAHLQSQTHIGKVVIQVRS